ncbi:MAG: hypothetical protein ACJ797_21170 [Ktedonobacteraceae bacterium]
MPTQEERLTALEQAQAKFGEAVNDLNHHVTILIGVASREEWDIREMKSSLRAIDGRLGSLEGRMGSLEGHFGSLEGRMGSLEGHFGSLEGRFETQEKKLDQVLLLLNTFTPKPE